MEERFDLALRVEPHARVGDWGVCPGEGGCRGGCGGGLGGGEVEEGAPRGGVAPATVGGGEDGVHVGFEGETTVLGEGWVRDCAGEVGFGGRGEGGGEAGERGELGVEGEEVAVAPGDGEGAEGEGEVDVVDGVGPSGGGGEGGGGDGEDEGHCGGGGDGV